MTAPIKVVCPYCGARAKRVTGAQLFPGRPKYALRGFWVCWPCDARVGTHLDGRPLGVLANSQLRRLRIQVHKQLDCIWMPARDRGRARNRAYQRLAAALRIRVEDCHIGEFDVAMCRRAIGALKAGEVTV